MNTENNQEITIHTDDNDDSKEINVIITEETTLLPQKDILPEILGVIAVQRRPLFPHMIIPLVIEGTVYQDTIKYALKKNSGHIGIFLAKNTFDDEKPEVHHLYPVGVVAKIVKVFSQDEESSNILLDVIGRIEITKVLSDVAPMQIQPCYIEETENDKSSNKKEIKAYCREIISNLKELIRLNPLLKEEVSQFVTQISIEDPSRLADFAVSLTSAEKEDLQEVLATFPIIERLAKALLLIKKELDLTRLQVEISKKIEDRISEHQREFFLREQLKEIQKELGIKKDDKNQEVDRIEKRAKKLNFPKAAQERFDEELQKLKLLDIQSPDFNIVRNYLEWITDLPWGIYTKDSSSIESAKKILERDHYGLEDLKTNILEFIATIQRRKKTTGIILCFVGPPGVGKTSIGKSIAKAMKRKFYRFSVGGMRDEAEIKGHRRTYIGAMPGKLLQALKTVKSANPIIMLDEIDKIGNSYHGDPASALLEVLDPEQNNAFLDHYLDIHFDLSKTIFITTANQLDTIPSPLLDRMEVIRLSGYILQEKLMIAKRFLLPRQRKEHGLMASELQISESALRTIIDGYAREAGVRNLEKQIRKICRKTVFELTENLEKKSVRIGVENISDYLKSPIFTDDELVGTGNIGVATGLAWTSMGGAVLMIEAINTPTGKGLTKTGNLGKVMIESADIAYSFVLSQAKQYKINVKPLNDSQVHLHVPAGATPKDGPSAGVTIATALLSLLTKKVVRKKLGMTGELSLTGEVLAIGGLQEKVIAARRVGLTEIIVPATNKKDFEELPEYLTEKMKFHFVKTYAEVYKIAFS